MSHLQNNEVIKEGCMIKRSQNKKPYTRVNYKNRLFVLTDQFLIYYDVIGNVSIYLIILFYYHFS